MFDAPLKVHFLMRDFKPDWFIAGGWAIDLFVGKETRKHKDIEIAIFRKDQFALQNYLLGWQLRKAQNGKLSVWEQNEFLELPIHEIHCLKQTAEPQSLEVLLNETNDSKWVFRRNAAISKPLSKLHLTSNLGMKFLCPEIVLLYKSKNPRLKDERDFETVTGRLDEESKKWLKDALSTCYNGHHWLQNL